MNKTSSGLDENVAGLLCYLVGWITGIIFLLLEQDNKFVRFHAMQSIIVFGILTVVSVGFSWVPILGVIVNVIVGIVTFILWVVLMVKAFQGTRFKMPWAGDVAEKWAG